MTRKTRGAVAVVVLSTLISIQDIGFGRQNDRIRLPSAEDAIKDRIRAEQLLRGGRGAERTLPGVVRDDEKVRVEVSPDGVPHQVVVDQRLRLRGTGDYFIKVPGPVRSARALSDSSAEPGLRSGSLVWQGFANDGELLGARVVLDPKTEAVRLPVQVVVNARLSGRPVALEDEMSGRLDLDITVTNQTGTDVDLDLAEVNDREVAAALDRVHRVLVGGERPEPGRFGIPRSIRALGPIGTVPVRILAPFEVRVVVGLGPRSRRIESPKAHIARRVSRVIVTRTMVLSGRRGQVGLHVSAKLNGSLPSIHFVAVPAPPAASEVAPPTGTSWREAADEGGVSSAAMLRRLMVVLSETANLADLDSYLGNPDRDGPATTTYRFDVVPVPVGARPEPSSEPASSGQSLLGMLAAAFLALFVVGALVVWWALS